jgi:hypothetical protein
LHKSLADLIECDSWIEKQKCEKITRRIKQIARVVKIQLGFSAYGFFMTSLVSFLEHELPLKMWFPFDHKSSEVLFWLTAFYQISGGFFISPMAVFVDFTPVVFMSYLAGVIEELSERFKRICDLGNPNAKRKSTENIAMNLKAIKSLEKMENFNELVECVKIHQQIVEIFAKFNEVLGKCTTSFALTIVSRSMFPIPLLHQFSLLDHRVHRLLVALHLHDPTDSPNPHPLLFRYDFDDGFRRAFKKLVPLPMGK